MLSLGLPSVVQAQNKQDTFADVAPSLRKESERLFLEGLKLAQQGNFKSAVGKFLASLRLLPNTKKSAYVRAVLHKYVARSYHRLKNYKKARDHYIRHLRLHPNGKDRARVQQWTKEVLQHLKAMLSLQVQPAADCLVVYQGGRWKGKGPASVPVFAGKVKVSCQAKGYLPVKKSITVNTGEEGSVRFFLEPKVVKPIRPPVQQPVAKAKPAWVGLMIGGFGLASVGAAGVMGGIALSEQEQAIQARDQSTQDGSTQALQLKSSADQKAFTANVLYISGGAVAVTGLVVFLVMQSQNSSTPPVKNTKTVIPKTSNHLHLRLP